MVSAGTQPFHEWPPRLAPSAWPPSSFLQTSWEPDAMASWEMPSRHKRLVGEQGASVSFRARGHPQLAGESLTRAQLRQPRLHPGLCWEGKGRSGLKTSLCLFGPRDPAYPPSRRAWSLSPVQLVCSGQSPKPDHSNNWPSLVTCPVWKTAPSCCTKRFLRLPAVLGANLSA